MGRNEPHSKELVSAADAAHTRACSAQLELLWLIREADRSDEWVDWGARDTAHWLSMRYGISSWKAHRWVAAAHALEELPRISEALERGELGLDKVVELCRFASSDTEARLISWAKRVSCWAIRSPRGPAEASLDPRGHRSREGSLLVLVVLRRGTPLRA